MKRKTFDNYDYEEAFPVELDRDIQKKARKNFEKEHPLQVPDYEEQWKEQQENRRSGRRSRSRVEKHKPGFNWILCEGVGQKEHLRKQEFQTKHGLQQNRLSVDTPS